LLVISGVFLAVGLRSANAQIEEALFGFGDELARWSDGRLGSAPRSLLINGLQLRVATATTDLPVAAALDHFQATCRRAGGVVGAENVDASLLDGVFRTDAPHEGVIACLDTGGPLQLDALAARLSEFAKGGNLRAIGKLRYFLARRDGKQTTVLAMWTEGDAELFRLFPKFGDAPGRDPEDVPRPLGSRRTLAAFEQGAPYSLTVYRVEQRTPRELEDWYANALQAASWSVSRGAGGLVARKGDRALTVRASAGRSAGSLVTVAELS
jgi:hypothetical protein